MAKVEVVMPKMGESITEGTVIAWRKQPGERVESEEILLEIGTDKVDTEVPSPAGGVLKEILVAEGETVDVGTAIAVLETEVDEEAAPETPEGASSGQEEEPQEAASTEHIEQDGEAEEPVAAEAAPAPEHDAASGQGAIEVVMPKMGESITEGTVIAWRKQPGERVESEEILLEIGTDKVDTEVPSPAGGVLKEILVAEGETVDVGTTIALITATESALETGAAPAPEAEDKQVAYAQTDQAPSGDGAAMPAEGEEQESVEREDSKGRFYSPLVRSIAEKEGLSMQEVERIPGSGHDGRVTKEDILGYLENRKAAKAPSGKQQPAPSATQPSVRKAEVREEVAAPEAEDTVSGGRVEIIEMDRMRQIIAEHMVRSKATSAHVTSFAEADVTNLVRLRERNKEAFLEREGVKLTYTPFFVHAVVDALREHPLLNASVEGKRILVKKDFHIGIAVAIGKTGLVAPVIRDAGGKNLVGLARAAAEMAERARAKQLQPDELQGGTFTITNIGSLGSVMGTPIINQPQVAILATGAIKKRPVVIEDPKLGDVIAIRHMMYFSLAYDHRIIDGAMSASFLQRVVSVLESLDPDAEL